MKLKSECIEHQFKCRGPGYGYLQHKGKQVLAHRLSYCKANDIDMLAIDGFVVRHKCDNPKCINPEHLELGTQADNIADMHSRGRGLRGERIGNSKITDEQADEIRRLYKPRSKDRNQYQIAKKFGITQSQVSMIITGKRRKQPTGDAA
ncbi:HNH endonuclease [Vreelandella aquamarina]|uniref:HNH endonuclease n=1 Tax=Vreelandella aquamarina TaxID=77097 RepID=UPI003CFD18B7